MSVWKEPTYSTAIPRLLWAVNPALTRLVYGLTYHRYAEPHRELDIDGDAHLDLAFAANWAEGSEEIGDDLRRYFAGVGRFCAGYEGIARVIRHIKSHKVKVKRGLDWERCNAITEHAVAVASHASQGNPGQFQSALGKMRPAENAEANRWYDWGRYLLWVSKLRRVSDLDEDDLWKSDREGVWTKVNIGGVIFLRPIGDEGNICICLTKAHLSHLVDLCGRIGNLYRALAHDPTIGPERISNAVGMLNLVLHKFTTARNRHLALVPRAFNKLWSLAKSATYGSILTEARDAEIAGYRKEGLHKVIAPEEFDDIIRGLDKATIVNIGTICRILPPPDYDPTRCLWDIKKYHLKPRKSGADPDATPEMRAMWDRVRDERAKNTAAAYRRINGHDAPRPKGAKLDRNWDAEGIFAYAQAGTDIAGYVKDKATVRDSLKAEAEAKEPAGSMLTWFMAHAGMVDTRVLLKQYGTAAWVEDNYVRVSYKAESHKHRSRLFYMAPPRTRILLSEKESNLARIAKHYPGSIIGLGTARVDEALDSIMNPYVIPEGAREPDDYSVYIVTFDLTKFSPGANPNVTKDYHAFWAKMFGVPDLAKLWTIGVKGKILHTTEGFVHHYTNNGADLEGFRGKMYTMAHCDMLAAACRLALEEGHLAGKGQLACFIDDGVVKIMVPGTGSVARRHALGFVGCMERVYAGAGQKINVQKVGMSENGGDMLSRVFIRGVELPQGLKAAAKIQPDYDAPADAITMEFGQLFASAQGAVKAGLDWVTAYKLYLVGCITDLMRWAGKHAAVVPTDKLAVLFFAPKSFGGFGLAGLQGLVTTAVINATMDGISILTLCARMIPGYKPHIDAILSKPVQIRDNMAILRDPVRVATEGVKIQEGRLVREIVKTLLNRGQGLDRFATRDQIQKAVDHAEAVADALLDTSTVDVLMLKKAWKLTPLCHIESVLGKFKRASSVLKLIGGRVIKKVRSANMRDVVGVLRA